MPHNRTRLWAGLAIVAITIPAVSTYYYRSTGSALQGAPIVVAGRTGVTPLGGGLGIDPGVVRSESRDYMAEVRAATGAVELTDPDVESALSMYDDDMFDPLPTLEEPRVAYDPEAEPPEPALAPVAQDSTPAVYTTNGPIADEPALTDQAPPTLSDANIYRLVVNNLPEDDRDEFVRAYAAMTNAQRIELLDGFRAELENDGS